MVEKKEVVRSQHANAVRVLRTGSKMILDFAFITPAGKKEKKGGNLVGEIARIMVDPEVAQTITALISKKL